MNKIGQFYIIAALLIVVAISGIITISTIAIANPTPNQINSFSSSLKEEGPKIVDYGIYSQNNVKQVLDNFTANDFAPYFFKETDNSSIVFIYGNMSNLYGVQYSLASRGTVSATIGGETSSWNVIGPYSQNILITPNPGDSMVNVTLLGKVYNFQLRDNQMFYFVIIQQKNGETYVKENS